MRACWIFILAFQLTACASIMKYEKSEQLKNNSEFENAIKIEKAPEGASEVAPAPTPVEATPPAGKKSKAKKTTKKSTAAKKQPISASESAGGIASKSASTPAKKSKVSSKKAPTAPAAPEAPAATAARQPDIEDTVGFAPGSRTPLQNPFRVGEVVTHTVSYFKMTGGQMRLKVEPFAQVNGKKAYTFAVELKTSSVFDSFYSVDDRVETLVDAEQLVPRTFSLHVKESAQLREARSIFDFDKNRATFWEKKVTKKDGEEEKKQEWEILPFSQNVYSAAFYMRVFNWEVGKEYSFRVADDEQNLVFKGTALRKEVLDTDLGPMKAIVIKPEVTLKGVFKPMGDIFIWLSDDEHKYILRIESKIKIGTIVSEVTNIVPGK